MTNICFSCYLLTEKWNTECLLNMKILISMYICVYVCIYLGIYVKCIYICMHVVSMRESNSTPCHRDTEKD